MVVVRRKGGGFVNPNFSLSDIGVTAGKAFWFRLYNNQATFLSGPRGATGPFDPGTEILTMGCHAIRDVSYVHFCDGSTIGPGNSFDISTNQTIKFSMDGQVLMEINKNTGVKCTYY